MSYEILVTGGAGFIGSNIVKYLVKHNAGVIRIVDNLSNGYLENILSFAFFRSQKPHLSYIGGITCFNFILLVP